MNKCVRKNCGKTIITTGYNRSKYPKGSTTFTTSYKTALCQECRKDVADKKPLYVTCTVCKKSIFIQQMMGGVRMTCNSICAKVRSSMLSKERYKKTHPMKTNTCFTCDRSFLGNIKYCSKLCYPKVGSTWFKIKRFEKLKKELKDIGYKV
jgi:hypothetical protein